MLGANSKTRAVRRRRLVVATALIAAVSAVVVVQAGASGVTLPTPAELSSSSQQAPGALRQKLAGQASATASAVVGSAAASVSCGQTITKSTTLTADLNCGASDGIDIGAKSVVLNLNGHFILGTSGFAGVSTSFPSDTIENGYVLDFNTGVLASGASDVVSKMLMAYTASVGVRLFGSKDQLVGSTVESTSGYGVVDQGSGDTITGDHMLNNANDGLLVLGGGEVISGDVANGNTLNGINVSAAPLATLTGNTADYNGAFGIRGVAPVIDGGKNAAKGNVTAVQCLDIVCA